MNTLKIDKSGYLSRDRRPPLNAREPGAPDEYSGFIIVRLAPDIPVIGGENLLEVAKELGLSPLVELLQEYELGESRRLIRSLSPEEILRLEDEARQSELWPLHSLATYWRLDARQHPGRMAEMTKQLNELREVDRAYLELAVSEPVVTPGDDTYNGSQDYLDAAPTGIDARWAWTQGIEGAGIRFIDLEQGWFPGHEDYTGKAPAIIYGDNRDGVAGYKGNHGTAVLGEVIADDNTRGVVGIAPSVSFVRMVSHYDAATNTDLHVADAILAAIPVLNPGDLLLLEVQRSYKPTEVDDADFDAIRLATAHGIIVVEAAGNGGDDLDAYTSGGDFILNRSHTDFRESGAIMVGAATSSTPHERKSFSNFGTRIDCYAWGENVVTCGYGFLDPGTGDNSTYTDLFNGTSSASPIITGAAILLQSRVEALTGTRLSPGQMRALLSDAATGTPQGPTVAGDIGVMPDLRAIIEDTLDLVPDVYLRDNVGDTGHIPSTGSISASPDIIVRPDPVANPTALFGEGSGNENSVTLGYEVEAGQDNFIYVRMRNRGGSNAEDVTATVYWSEVATLITPDMWHLIDTSAPVDVPMGDTLVVAPHITWPEGDIPAEGHYCFVGLLEHPRDAAPPLPPGPPAFDMNDFRDFIRAHNNVTWRNFNVVDDLPDPEGDPAVWPFLIAGAPEKTYVFDLEISRRLPREAQLWLEVPPVLVRQLLRDRQWQVKVEYDDNVARIALPPLPLLKFPRVKLPGSARYRARFLVQGVKEMEKGGHGVAIRQLYRGDEVGRITWLFHRRKREG